MAPRARQPRGTGSTENLTDHCGRDDSPRACGRSPTHTGCASYPEHRLELLRAYALSVGALDRSSTEEFFTRSTAGVLWAAKAHAEVTRVYPATLFLELLCSLFAASIIPPLFRACWESNQLMCSGLRSPRKLVHEALLRWARFLFSTRTVYIPCRLP
jgi:hypothetical protein